MDDMEKTQVMESSEDFAAMLEDSEASVHTGQVVKGQIVQLSDDGVIVDIPGMV